MAPAAAGRNHALGILAGLGAGMIWGADFLVPQVLQGFSSLEFAFGRSFFFGLTSLLFCRPAIAAFRKFSIADRLTVFGLSAAGFWLYSLLLFWAVSHGDAVATALVVGAIPAAMALASRSPAARRPSFMLGVALLLAGLLALHAAGLQDALRRGWVVWLLPLACLALWTWYGLRNAAFIRRHPNLSRTDLVSMIGLITFAVMTLAGVCLADLPRLLHHDRLGVYVLWSALMGAGSSWAGLWLWNICARRCPPAMAAPLLVAETVFALLYTFLYQQRWPHLLEALAMGLFISGAFLVVRAESTASYQDT